LVIERKEQDKAILTVYCGIASCNHKLHEVYFELNDIEKDFIPHFEYFYKSLALRTCEKCGTVMETDPRFVAIE
jgi:3-hydroxyanthranilate 3,4-dioxygenase